MKSVPLKCFNEANELTLQGYTTAIPAGVKTALNFLQLCLHSHSLHQYNHDGV